MRDKNFELDIRMYFYILWNDTRITKIANTNETSWQPVKASFARSKLYISELYFYYVAKYQTMQALDIPMDFFYLKNSSIR